MNKEKGFTLVELLIYMGLLVVFVLVLSNIFSSILSVKTESESISAVEQDGRFIMTRLTYDINRADSITTPAAAGDSGSSLELVIGGVTNTYSLSGNNLQITNAQGTDNLNSSESSVSSIDFQRLGSDGDNDTVRIQFTVNSVAQRNSGVESNDFTVAAGIR